MTLKILFPMDGSEASLNTLRWATRYLRKHRASIEIFLFVVAESLDIDYSVECMEEILTRAAECLKEQGFDQVHVDYRINQKAPEAICGYADQQGIDQIIIGSHGKQLAQRIIGSISREVLENAAQPVLLLKNTGDAEIEMSSPRTFSFNLPERLTVLLPVDRADSAEQLLAVAGNLLTSSMTLHLLHVTDSADKTGQSHEMLLGNQRFLEDKGFSNLVCEVRVGKASQEICRYADEKGVDDIFMAAHDREPWEKFFFGSVSKAVLECARQPVLVFKPGEKNTLSISHANQIDFTQRPE